MQRALVVALGVAAVMAVAGCAAGPPMRKPVGAEAEAVTTWCRAVTQDPDAKVTRLGPAGLTECRVWGVAMFLPGRAP